VCYGGGSLARKRENGGYLEWKCVTRVIVA